MERFTAITETNATHSRELRTTFVAFLLVPPCWLLHGEGQFAAIGYRGPNLFG